MRAKQKIEKKYCKVLPFDILWDTLTAVDKAEVESEVLAKG